MPHVKRKKTFKSLSDPAQKMFHNFDTIEKGLAKEKALKKRMRKPAKKSKRGRNA